MLCAVRAARMGLIVVLTFLSEYDQKPARMGVRCHGETLNVVLSNQVSHFHTCVAQGENTGKLGQ